MKIKDIFKYYDDNDDKIMHSKLIIVVAFLIGLFHFSIYSIIDANGFWNSITFFLKFILIGIIIHIGVSCLYYIGMLIDIKTPKNVISRFIELRGLESDSPTLLEYIRISISASKLAIIVGSVLEILLILVYLIANDLPEFLVFFISVPHALFLGCSMVDVLFLLPLKEIMEKKYNRIPKD